MKTISTLLLGFLALVSSQVSAQKYITKEGQIEIFSQTPIFTIEGKNTKVGSILNTETGEIVASTLVRSFKFHEALVEDHFNENYMESEKFPKATFKGTIVNFKSIDLTKDGENKISIKGELMLHGETRPIEVPGTLTIAANKITGKTSFDISLANYKIKVEERYKDAIKDDIKLSIVFEYSPQAK